VRLRIENPPDGLITERCQMVSGWVDAPEPVTIEAWCDERTIPLRPFVHPNAHCDERVRGFWGYLVLQEHLDAIRDATLTLDVRCQGNPLGRISLRVSPLAEILAREYPLNLATYAVPPAIASDARQAPAHPVTLVFPGLGGVGGASLNLLMRRKMLAEGWDLPLYFEADDPLRWSRIAGRRRPRWIDGHRCYAAGDRLAQPSVRMTLLRDPVRRLLSVFNYATLVHPYDFPFRRLEDFVLSGAARTHGLAFGLLRAAGATVPENIPDRDLYEHAHRELDRHYALVGITELFEETIFLAGALAGYDRIGMWWRVLSAPPGIAATRLTPEVERALALQTVVDRQLYEESKAALLARARTTLAPAALAQYRRDAEAQPELPAAYKMVECLRWRQLLHEGTRVSAEASSVARAAS
jgi:hypothetical protein